MTVFNDLFTFFYPSYFCIEVSELHLYLRMHPDVRLLLLLVPELFWLFAIRFVRITIILVIFIILLLIFGAIFFSVFYQLLKGRVSSEELMDIRLSKFNVFCNVSPTVFCNVPPNPQLYSVLCFLPYFAMSPKFPSVFCTAPPTVFESANCASYRILQCA